MATAELAIPPEVVALSEERNVDLGRWLTELAVLDAYQEGRISAGKVGEILGLNGLETQGWLTIRESHLGSIDLLPGQTGIVRKHDASASVTKTNGRKEPIPVAIPPAGRQIMAMTNADLFEAIEADF
ncbi:hypothetical protein EON82_21100 [bacterium]|nr:MAG: hypothetical protein EON82_21100 [bacterium]